jgi:hypothetical protein
MALIARTTSATGRAPFVAFNIALALHIAALIATDWHPFGYRLLAIAGSLEGIALAWWMIVAMRAALRTPSRDALTA